MPDSAPTRATMAAPPTGEAAPIIAVIGSSGRRPARRPTAGCIHAASANRLRSTEAWRASADMKTSSPSQTLPARPVPLQLRTIRQSRHRATAPPPKRFRRRGAPRVGPSASTAYQLSTGFRPAPGSRVDLIAGNRHFQGPGIANSPMYFRFGNAVWVMCTGYHKHIGFLLFLQAHCYHSIVT